MTLFVTCSKIDWNVIEKLFVVFAKVGTKMAICCEMVPGSEGISFIMNCPFCFVCLAYYTCINFRTVELESISVIRERLKRRYKTMYLFRACPKIKISPLSFSLSLSLSLSLSSEEEEESKGIL